MDDMKLTRDNLDPVVTAAITYRLGNALQLDVTAKLAACVSWTPSEVTRFLNAAFASTTWKALAQTESAEDARAAALRLVTALASASPESAARSGFVDKTIAMYRGTLSDSDRLLAQVYQLIELAGGSVARALATWTPSRDEMVFGDGAASRIAALTTLDEDMLEKSWAVLAGSSATGEAVYDPTLILSLLRQALLDDDLRPADLAAAFASGAVSLAFAGLASSHEAARSMCRAIMAICHDRLLHLEVKDKDDYTLIVGHARYCVFSEQGEPIPALIAMFLARAAALIGRPDRDMYPLVHRFLLQRPEVDQNDVPMLYQLLYTSGRHPVDERRWLLALVGEGLVRPQDWRILRRRRTLDLLASLYHGERDEARSRELVLQFILRAASIPRVASEMITRGAWFSWLSLAQPAATLDDAHKLFAVTASLAHSLRAQHSPLHLADGLDALVLALKRDVASHSSSFCAALHHILDLAQLREMDPTTEAALLKLAKSGLELAAPHATHELSFFQAATGYMYLCHRRGEADDTLFAAAARSALRSGHESLVALAPRRK